MNRLLSALPLLALGLSASCAAAPTTRSPSAAQTLTVIATTDFHGAVDPAETRLGGGRSITIGGPDVMSAYLNILKSKTPGPVLYLDAGDLFQGTMASNLYEGKPVMRLYNYMAPAAVALGNHEFDYGPVGPKSVPLSPGDDGQGALKARIAEANFPFLAANVKDDSGQTPPWLKASIVKDVGGVRVGIIGEGDAGTPSSTNALNLAGLHFADPYETVLQEAQHLRNDEHVDAVVLVIHEGGGCDDNSIENQDDLSSCKITDIFGLVQKLPEGLVDVVVAGHTHHGVAKRIGRTAIIQPFAQGKYVAWASIPLGANAAGEKPKAEGLVPVCKEVVQGPKGKTCDYFDLKGVRDAYPEPATFLGEPIVPDSKAIDVLQPELGQVQSLKEAPLGVSAEDDIVRSYSDEGALNNLVADASKDMIPGLDLGLTNGGGLRDNIRRGPLTYGDIFNVLPFDNQLAVVQLTGAQIVSLLEDGRRNNHGGYNWSYNLHVVIDGCNVTSATIDGQPLDPNKVYAVATSDFLAGGGSGFAAAKADPSAVKIYYDQQFILRDLTVNVLKSWNKTLRSGDFYNRALPRTVIHGTCEASGS